MNPIKWPQTFLYRTENKYLLHAALAQVELTEEAQDEEMNEPQLLHP